jgi:hypothetical protein
MPSMKVADPKRASAKRPLKPSGGKIDEITNLPEPKQPTVSLTANSPFDFASHIVHNSVASKKSLMGRHSEIGAKEIPFYADLSSAARKLANMSTKEEAVITGSKVGDEYTEFR